MRLLRFILREFVLRGLLFAVLGTAALSSLYLASVGADAEAYAAAGKAFLRMLTLSPDLSSARPGFSAARIIGAGAAVTLPLALASLVLLALWALASASFKSGARMLAAEYGRGGAAAAAEVLGALSSAAAALPLFAAFWLLACRFGSEAPFPLIAAATVAAGGLGWDAARFLERDMAREGASTHAQSFASLGEPIGLLAPLPGTYSGYLLASAAPRFLPYLAGKVPAVIGCAAVAEAIFSFPGLGGTLMEALLSSDADLLVASVFVLLCVDAAAAFAVKGVLFALYPRWYEKTT